MKCRICKSNNLIDILSLGNQYLSEFRDDNVRPAQYPLDLVICADCNQVQLKNTVPQDMLYSDNYGYRSGINTTMKNHLRELAYEAMETADADSGDNIVDIGSNDGTLLKSFPDWFNKTGYDLVPKFGLDYLDTRIEFVNEPFTAKSYNRKAKIITAISMFYDIDDPVSLLTDMAKCLDKKGIIVIQQNYLLSMLKNNAFDNCCHEHLCYHSLQSMVRIADKCGLDVFDVSVNDLNGGSFRTYLCHKGDYRILRIVDHQLKKETDYELDHIGAYLDFASRVYLTAHTLYQFLSSVAYDKQTCYAYGASTRGNTLLQYCKLDNQLVQKAAERNPEKYGLKIASLDIPIISEEQMRREKPSHLLILPWFFKKEFIKREDKYLKEGGKLIFPLPKLSVVNK